MRFNLRLATSWLCRASALVLMVSIVIVVVGGRPAAACPYSIRDSAFMPAEASTFRLIFIADDEAEAIADLRAEVEESAEIWLHDVNVMAETVAATSPLAGRVLGSLNDVDDLTYPVAALVAPQGEVLLVAESADAEEADAWVMDTIARVADSPGRQQVLEQLTRAWCVVIMRPGGDAAENNRVREAVRAAAERVEGTTTEMDKVVTVAPELIEFDPNAVEEHVLLWSAGIDVGDEANKPTIAMIVGRGQQRGPVLIGEMISADAVFEMFEMLGRSCTCTTDPIWITGRSLPIIWDLETRQLAQIELGFDPDDPDAVDLMRNSIGTGAGALGGYQEITFDPVAATVMATEGEAAAPESGATDDASDEGSSEETTPAAATDEAETTLNPAVAAVAGEDADGGASAVGNEGISGVSLITVLCGMFVVALAGLGMATLAMLRR